MSYKDHVCHLDSVGSHITCGIRSCENYKIQPNFFLMRPSICLCLISYSLWPPPFLSKGTKVPRMTHLDAFICKVVCALYFLSLSLLAYQNEKGWRNWPFSERCQLPQAPLIWVAISSVRRGDPAHMIIMGLASKKQGFRLLLLMPQPPPSATRARDLTWLQKRQEMGKKRYRKENVRKKKKLCSSVH